MKQLLETIESKIRELPEEDVQGHIYWGRFREMVVEQMSFEFFKNNLSLNPLH